MNILRKKGFTLVELMIVVAIIGILAAIAIPNFIRFQAKSKQAEAKTNLKAVFTGQKSRFGERDRYSDFLGEIGFAPERGNRYSYDLGDGAGGVGMAASEMLICGNVEQRTAAVIDAAMGTQFCGVGPDIFRYQANIAPMQLDNRGSVAFVTTVLMGTDLGTDAVGYNSAACPNCDFAARAVGNIDNDEGGDEFLVSSQFGSIAMGTPCAEETPMGVQEQPGSPINARNDVNCD